jgi:GDP-mannose 6-dehydrogenase
LCTARTAKRITNELRLAEALRVGVLERACPPKDLKALRTIAHDHYLQAPVLESIERSNEFQKGLVSKRNLDFGVQKIGIIGLAFKYSTDDLRDSPIIDVLERLLGKEFTVHVYDPHVHIASLTGANREYFLHRIPFIARYLTGGLSAVFSHAELIVAVNREPKLDELFRSLKSPLIVYDLTV